MPASVTESSPPAELLPFETTCWSVVLAAGAGGGTEAQTALGELCRLYWTPAYVWLRRRGLGRPDAQDLTQDFFAHLLAGEGLGVLRPGVGRFRAFLLRCLRNFLVDAHRRRGALRRGGGRPLVPLDRLDEVDRQFLSPTPPPAPDEAFDRRWAEIVVAQATAVVREEYAARSLAEMFEQLQPLLLGAKDEELALAGAALDLRPVATRAALARLRDRFRAVLRWEVARTLGDPATELQDELRHLLNALAPSR